MTVLDARRVRIVSTRPLFFGTGWLLPTALPVKEGGPSSPPEYEEVEVFVPDHPAYSGRAPFYVPEGASVEDLPWEL